ncbi:MAG TPA: O-antigen ligase family protein, partial [Burkholderiales bacterium]|nr:O-antigen ligase family protein [Burkholderiales bacterium]
IPFVEWPGSAIRFGIEALIKAVVFYYFTIAFVDSESRLKRFLLVFVGCQLFRVMEPLYLHFTQGYWGSFASMADWEYLDRLSGAPSDIVNPNGLAYIICTVLPFLYFAAQISLLNRLAFLVFTPLCVYALMLTGSRTGFLGLIFVCLGIVFKAKQRLAVGLVFGTVLLVGFPLLSADMQDRYLSIFVSGTKNDFTAQGRMTGVISNFEVASRHPLFGYGLGTSLEANANFAGNDQVAHNLYAEAATEVGFVGMAILVAFIVALCKAFHDLKRSLASVDEKKFLLPVVDATQVWLVLNLVFSFASYGLTSYEWYLLGGLAVVYRRIASMNPSIEVRPNVQDSDSLEPDDYNLLPKA